MTEDQNLPPAESSAGVVLDNTFESASTKYWAFISYSNKDARWGSWLHRALETYKVPKKLVTQGAPLRLYPVFRDRDELGAGLTARLERALRESRTLVVICSPNSARSTWVDDEIRAFNAVGRADRIFALIVAGEPNSGDPATECFPSALRDQEPTVTLSRLAANGILAADVRVDGRSNALLKLVAGILDVEYDQLKQREQERQLQRRMRWASASIGLSVVFAALAGYAFMERATAEDRLKVAVSRQLAAQALTQAGTRTDLALLLAVEATRPADTVEARSALLKILQSTPGLTRFFHGHTGPVTAVVFSPDGRLVASGGADGTVRLWPVDGRAPRDRPLFSHERARVNTKKDAVTILGFSPDGAVLASGSYYGGFRLADVSKLTPRLAEKVFNRTVRALAFSADSKQILTGGTELRSYGLDTLTDLSERALASFPDAVASSPDNRTVAVAGDDGLFLVDATTGEAIGAALAPRGEPAVLRMAYSSNGQVLAAAGSDGSVRAWNLSTRQLLGEPARGDGTVLALSFVGDDRLMFARSDGTVRLWSVQQWRQVRSIGFQSAVTSAAVSPNGELAAAGLSDGKVAIWDLRDEERVVGRTVSRSAQPEAVAFSPDGHYVVTNGGAIDIGSQQADPLVDPTAKSYSFSADGRTLVTGGHGFVVIDVLSGRRSYTPSKEGDTTWTAVISPDGTTVAVGSHQLMLWDVKSRAPLGPPLLTQAVHAVAFSPDGSILAAGADDGFTRLWTVKTQKTLGRAMKLGEPVDAVAFRRDGKLLATGGERGTLQLWTVANQEPRGAPLPGFKSSIGGVAFSPDGTLLAAVGFKRLALIYDVESRQLLGEPLFTESEYDILSGAAFSPDGDLLAISDRDYKLHLIDGSPEAWRRRACLIANRILTRAEWDQYIGGSLPYHVTCEPAPEPTTR